jgi:iron-sulfur cluster assembly protein
MTAKPQGETMIQLTPSAAKAISRFIKYSDPPVSACRVSVSDGGCSGFKYKLNLEAGPSVGDHLLEVAGVRLLIDPASRPLLDGVTLDFVDRLTESGFKFTNPNAKAACGCGKSFSV